MTYQLAGIGLGSINEESHDVVSSLDHYNFPASGTKDAEAFDNGDTKRTIQLSGVYSATALVTLANWINSIDALQNGSQDNVIFHSDLWAAVTTEIRYSNGDFTVKVESFKHKYKGGSPLIVTYSLSLVESV